MAQTGDWYISPPFYPTSAETYYGGTSGTTGFASQGAGVVSVASAGLHNIESVPTMGSITSRADHMSSQPTSAVFTAGAFPPPVGGALHSLVGGVNTHPVMLDGNKKSPVGWRAYEGPPNLMRRRMTVERAVEKEKLDAAQADPSRRPPTEQLGNLNPPDIGLLSTMVIVLVLAGVTGFIFKSNNRQ